MRRWFLIVVGVLGLAGPVSAQTTVGVNASVENSVRTRSTGEGAWRASVVDGTVREADAIVTGAESRLLIRLRDDSMLTVGAQASLVVDRFVIDTEADPAGVLFSMVRGAFRYVSGSRGSERERVAFRTPTATIGIRGTIIEAAVGSEALELLAGEGGARDPEADPEQSALIVLVEGEIEIEADGVRRTVSEPGEAVFVSGRRVSEPFRLSPEAGQRLAGRLPPREPSGPGAGPQGPGQGRREGQGPGAQAPRGQQPQGRENGSRGDRGPSSRAGAAGTGQSQGSVAANPPR